MQVIDVLLAPLIPTLVLLHLYLSPYTKVEESFNIQATHDILTYSTPFTNTTSRLSVYDHFSFPGAVPRTFVGAYLLAQISRPVIFLTRSQNSQLVVRAVLGLFNAWTVDRYGRGLGKVYGRDVGRWFILLQASQFHFVYYASRTLPNMFAFGLTFGQFLPSPGPTEKIQVEKSQRYGIILFVLAGVIFRAEIALLLFTQLAYLLLQSRISLKTLIPAGTGGAVAALLVSVPLDSYFWQQLIWPEFAGFYFNAIEGKSSDWGTSPPLYYFTSVLPKLLNPINLLFLIPLAFILPSTRYAARDLVIPSLSFVTIYSLQPHKEWRFIVYVIPPLTAAASLSASYLWTRRYKFPFYTIGAVLVSISLLAFTTFSFFSLMVSVFNYPGGDALASLHSIISRTQTQSPNITIHMDVLSCMTGVTRFQQSPLYFYDKTEIREELGKPEFWAQFDYALMEEPELAIGKWEVLDTVWGYAGIEFLRPGDGSSFSERLESVYEANNVTENEEVRGSEEVRNAIEEGEEEASKGWADIKSKLLLEELSAFETFNLCRDAVRLITGGYWFGPRMKPKIRILRRLSEEEV
ncbi:hypothetical protein B7494_g1966 [Chlorociboria aeruginascens]|nr:hypothetical protein B7494_g1966 [Chlorociboria aeruginascens]